MENNTVENIQYLQIQIPDLNNTPYIIKSIVLNEKTYYFEYFWNLRHGKAYLSIYLIVDNNKVYLVKNRHLTIFLNVSEYIFDSENWSGNLFFDSIDSSYISDYTQQNISEKYILRYIP